MAVRLGVAHFPLSAVRMADGTEGGRLWARERCTRGVHIGTALWEQYEGPAQACSVQSTMGRGCCGQVPYFQEQSNTTPHNSGMNEMSLWPPCCHDVRLVITGWSRGAYPSVGLTLLTQRDSGS